MVINLVSCSILLLVFSLGDALERRNLMMKPKGTIKTIESIEDGDTIDCVDYYQQPAFDNPMLKKSQVHPSYIPSGIKMSNNSGIKLRQTWHKYGSCPDGTVPIRRGRKNHRFPKYPNAENPGKHEVQRETDQIYTSETLGLFGVTPKHATVYQTGTFYGGAANINLWNPHTEVVNEFSLSQIWVTTAIGTPNGNSVEAGWMVYPEKFGDGLTRLFVFFTNDNYQETVCYDLECDNFVQLPGSVSLGCSFEGSEYDGPQYDIKCNIHKDEDPHGHWWVVLNDIPVGYWSRDLFTSLSHSADEVSWGGEIVNKETAGLHTSTHMGSGRFPHEGLGKASYFRQVSVMNVNRKWVAASFSDEGTTNPLCYDIEVQPLGTNYGTYFLYGGPGLSAQCYDDT